MRLALLAAAILCALAGSEARKHTNVVFLGATGDLAKKYLWQAFFELQQGAPTDETFRFYAAARNPVETGAPLIKEILEKSIKCSTDACTTNKAAFAKLVEYVQLKDDNDYVRLGAALGQSSEETGRLFYLSIPPFAYEKTTGLIDAHLRPSASAWMRVVVEKPFGEDYHSAREMAVALGKVLSESEIYRIDHYLGKRGVKQIAAFFQANKELANTLLRKEHVARVDIVMTEKDDCRHRTNFYNSYGVIRDVLQNHLTEILALVAADVSDSRPWGVVKATLFEHTTGSADETLIGQYGEYNQHYREDQRNGHAFSLTPTFAAAVLNIKNDRWAGVPFVLVSGKSMSERRAYIKITFRNDPDQVCMGSPSCAHRDIVFNIQGGTLDVPATVLTGEFGNVNVPEGWTSKSTAEAGHQVLFPPANLGSDAPYNALIAEVYRGVQDDFVTTHALLSSWKIWTPILQGLRARKPRLYSKGGKEVQFKVDQSRRISYIFAEPSHEEL